MKRALSTIMLIAFLMSMLTFSSSLQSVKASGTVYIRADGSIDPPTAPISTADNITYVFLTNMNDSIVVERDNIIIDGEGYTVQGSGSGNGLYWSGISNVTVKNTNIKGFSHGISVGIHSLYNSISGNNITNNGFGVYIDSSSNNNSISGNNITNNDNVGVWLWLHSNNNSISENNITANNDCGIVIWSWNTSISGNSITNNGEGIGLCDSFRNSVSGNNITNNGFGVWFDCSNSNSVSGNNITNNGVGVYFDSNDKDAPSKYNSVSGNSIANNGFGIQLGSSSNNNSISGNNFTASSSCGISLYSSSNTSISGNTFTDDGLAIFYSYQNFVEGNTVNGKPLVYLEDRSDYSVGDAGQVILVNCDSIRVEDLNLSKASRGVQLLNTTNSVIARNTIANNYNGVWFDSSSDNSISENNITANNFYGISLDSFSNNNSINGNNIADNEYGIRLDSSSDNSISENNITANNFCGISLHSSSDNTVYHNNFVENTLQVNSPGSINVWDDGYPSGGNFWSDYTGVDANGDGIGDTAYVINVNNTDRYPLYLTPLPTPDFSTAASPTSLTIRRGNSDTSVITITSTNGFHQPVQLTVSGAPSGVSVTLNPEQVTPPSDGSTTSTLTVSVGTTATLGSYTLTVTGTNGTLTHNVNISLEVTALFPTPSITEVKAFYTLDSFFLLNMPDLVPPNQYFVRGTNIERVEFTIYIDGVEHVYQDTSPDPDGWYNSEQYDMAHVTSNLTISAYNEVDTLVQETVDTHVFDTPFWLREIIILAIGANQIEITTDPGSGFDNVWKLSANFAWPDPPMKEEVDLSSLPIIGGKYGVSAGFGFGLSLASDKSVTAEGSGSFKVTIGDYEGGVDIHAQAVIHIGSSIELEDFVIDVHGNIMIPIKKDYKWDVWKFSIGVEVGIDFEADVSFSFHVEEATSGGTFCDGFDWVSSANDIRFTMRPYAAAGVVVGELRVEGEGYVTFTVHVPGPYFTYPDDLTVGARIKLILKTFLHTWEWTVLDYSSGSPVEWTVNASGRGWINRTWATGDYAEYVWAENTTAGNYLENVYLYANPSVAASSETVMMVWTHDDLSKPYIQGYEVYYSLWYPETGVWSSPSPVTNNTIPEDDVIVKFDALGNAVAVWSQINNSSLSESVDPFSLFNQAELAYAVWNHTTGLWTEPALITNNSAYDYSPLLTGDQNGNLMLTWLVDEDSDCSTFDDLSIYAATWNGEQWSNHAFVANPGLVSSPIQAAYDQGEAVLVWSSHTDGNLTTLDDTEIFYCRLSGQNWSSPTQLTDNILQDTEPSVAFRNNPVFAWIQRNETDALMFLDPENGTTRSVLERTGVSSPRLSVDAQNHTLIIWADPASQTPFSFSLSPDGNITFVELLEQSSQRNIYCTTCPYRNVVANMELDSRIHVVDLDAQVSVVNVTCHAPIVTRGKYASTDITINNEGYFAQPCNITVYANSTAVWQFSGILNGETNTSLLAQWKATDLAEGNYTIWVSAEPVPGETYTADNTFVDSWVIIVSVVGDITGPDGFPDGKCDMRDISLVARNFGLTVPPAPAKCDLTGPTQGVPDGKIDMRDIGLVARHFGETGP